MVRAWRLLNPDRIDFKTHYRYAQCLNKLSTNLSMTCTLTPGVSRADLILARDKSRLLTLTRTSIQHEYSIVQADQDYSTAAVLWLPMKCYYLLYHLLTIIEFLLSGDRAAFRMTHGDCLRVFTERLRRSEIAFNEPRLNMVFDQKIFAFKERSGEHLSSAASDDLLFQLAMKKIGSYKIEDYRRAAHINMRTKEGRAKLQKYRASKFTVSIFDFFYFMRIKASYRDFNFVDAMPADQTARYFAEYYTTADNFSRCVSQLRSQLVSAIRK